MSHDEETRAVFLGLASSGLTALDRWRLATGRPIPSMAEAEKDAATDRINRQERLGQYAVRGAS